ncbi:DUF342 domain-containing protein [Candidatus Dependentiae bacterium]|nr:DUF342 domain-containing protein [Candidatus Dependentiae bacterium]
MPDRQLFIISDINETNNELVYSFGRYLFLFDSISIFEIIEKKYLEVAPGQLLYSFIDKTGTKNDTGIIPGKNVAISSDGTKIFSTISGLIQWKHNELNVLPVIEIDSDASVELGTGNIDFDGSVIVHGIIDSGSIINVTGDIFTYKILDSELNCGGNIISRDGIFNFQNGFLNCGGNIKTPRIEKSTNIKCSGNIIVEDIIKDCFIESGKSLILTGPGERAIERSELFIRNEVSANRIGSRRESIYTLETGIEDSQIKVLLEYILSMDQLEKEINDIENFLVSNAVDDKRAQEYYKNIDNLKNRYNTLKINADEIYPKINFDKINEYFAKYSTPGSEEEVSADYVFVLKRYKEKLSFLDADIRKYEDERKKIESEKLDDKSLERLEQIENHIESVNHKKKYFSELCSLLYIPANKTKVVLDSEPISINLGMFKNERDEYNKIIDQKKFCERNLITLKNEIEQLKKNNVPQTDSRFSKKTESIIQINKTLTELSEKVKPFDSIINNNGRRIVGVDGNIVEGVKIVLDGIEKIIEKKYEKIAFSSSFENIVMEGFVKPDIEKIIYSNDSIKTESGQPVIFENLKLRKNALFEGYDSQLLYQLAVKFLNIPSQNALFIDVDRYMSQSKKILRLNAILIGKNEDKNALRQMFFKIKNSYPIQIAGASIKECMQKGVEHFQCSEDDLDYEILQHPNKSFLNLKKQTYVIKIFKKGKERKDLDGFFVILNTIKGLMLTSFPPRGNGKKAKVEEAIQQLREFNYNSGIDLEILKNEMEKSSAEEVKIGPRQPEPELDGKYFFNISSDKMQVYITLIPPQYGGLPVDYDEIKNKIIEKNIYKPNLDLIKNSLKNLKKKMELLISEGINPVSGQDAVLLFPFVNQNKEKSSEEKQLEEIYGIQPLDSVRSKDLIVKKIPPKEGTPGINVFGEEISPPKGKNFQLRAGKNAVLSEDGLKISAQISGMAFREGYKFYVEEALHIIGNIDNRTGNITFPGTVIISGTIKEGFSVKAGGDIYVSNIEGATVECGNNLYVRRGISGNYKCKITVKGNMITNFIEQATVFCRRNVIVSNSLMHSVVNAAQNVVVLTGGKGLIVGGIIRAGKSVFAKILGSKIATVTTVEAGSDPEVFEKMKKSETYIVSLEKFYKSGRLDIKRLLELKAKNEFTEKHEEMLDKLRNQDEEIVKRLKKLVEDRKILAEIIEKGKDGKICVSEKCFTGIRLTISTAKIKVDHVTDFVTYFYLDNQIRIKPYEPPVDELFEELKKENIKLVKI